MNLVGREFVSDRQQQSVLIHQESEVGIVGEASRFGCSALDVCHKPREPLARASEIDPESFDECGILRRFRHPARNRKPLFESGHKGRALLQSRQRRQARVCGGHRTDCVEGCVAGWLLKEQALDRRIFRLQPGQIIIHQRGDSFDPRLRFVGPPPGLVQRRLGIRRQIGKGRQGFRGEHPRQPGWRFDAFRRSLQLSNLLRYIAERLQQAQMRIHSGEEARFQQRALQQRESAGLYGVERSDEVAAVDGGHGDGPQRLQGVRCVPVVEMSREERQPRHGSIAALHQFHILRHGKEPKLARCLPCIEQQPQVGGRDARGFEQAVFLYIVRDEVIVACAAELEEESPDTQGILAQEQVVFLAQLLTWRSRRPVEPGRDIVLKAPEDEDRCSRDQRDGMKESKNKSNDGRDDGVRARYRSTAEMRRCEDSASAAVSHSSRRCPVTMRRTIARTMASMAIIVW